MNLIAIKINNKSFGKLNGFTVYLDKPLYQDLEKEKTKEGISLINIFRNGMALRGLKHLLELLISRNESRKIVLTKAATSKTGAEWIINYNDYRESTSEKFYAFYRETGLDAASYFLSQKLPEDFKYTTDRLTGEQIKNADKKLPEILEKLEKKAKHKKAILSSTSNIINELKEKKTLLKKEVEQLEKIKNESNIAVMLNAISDFDKRLNSRKAYRETSGKNSWQKWVYKNNWMFGSYYLQPIEKQRIGLDSIPDFLFPTIDGFIDILEIKLPTHDVINEDSSHAGSFMWSPKSSEAIGQVVTYLSEIEMNQLLIQQKIKEKYNLELNVVKPRAYILVGVSSGWVPSKAKALRKLNYSLHGIEVLTYSDLKKRAEQIIKIFNTKLGELNQT